MSTHPSTSGSHYSGTSQCYRSALEPAHLHPGPYRPCQACRRTICPDCIVAETENGGVLCVECYRNHSRAGGSRDTTRRKFDILLWHISGDTLLVAIGSLLCVLIVLLLGAMLYGEINDIPRGRVTVAIVAAVMCWIVVALQILRWVSDAFGEMTGRVAAFLVAFIAAILFGLVLMNWTFIDTVLEFLT